MPSIDTCMITYLAMENLTAVQKLAPPLLVSEYDQMGTGGIRTLIENYLADVIDKVWDDCVANFNHGILCFDLDFVPELIERVALITSAPTLKTIPYEEWLTTGFQLFEEEEDATKNAKSA